MNKDLSQFIFLFAHGAGADMNSQWMLDFDQLLSDKGLKVVRFNFPYMLKSAEDGKRRPPDRQPKLLQAFKQQLAQLPQDKKVIIGGKSMGGRMASLLAADDELVANVVAVVCLGYPFHPVKKLEGYKGEHLATISKPTLILQGERDNMGTRDEIAGYSLSNQVSVNFLLDGDHSFKPRVKSGLTLQSNMLQASEKMIDFVNSL